MVSSGSIFAIYFLIAMSVFFGLVLVIGILIPVAYLIIGQGNCDLLQARFWALFDGK